MTDRLPPPDYWDQALSALLPAVMGLGPLLAIWQARSEPNAHARRCASDAIDAVDTALAALHRIRARLVTEVRQADDQAAARADELLARTRDGPQAVTPAPGDHRTTRPRRHPDAEALCAHGNAGGNDGRAPREATP
jgi:hypothetical protein